MGYRYFDDQRLWDLTVEVFTRNGYSRSDCEDIANVLLASDRMGIESPRRAAHEALYAFSGDRPHQARREE